MTQFICDLPMDSEFLATDILDKNFYDNIGSDLNPPLSGIDSDIDNVFNFSKIDGNNLLNGNVHSVFDEIANIKPTAYSSSEEDDRNLIMSWDINEQDLDTLPDSVVCCIKQEEIEDLTTSSDGESIEKGLSSSPTSSIEMGIIETPPVSPEVRPLTITGSPPSVNVLVIDSKSLSNGSKLVPVTPLRSHFKRNYIKKVPSNEISEQSNSSMLTSVQVSTHHHRPLNGHKIVPSSYNIRTSSTDYCKSLLLPKNEKNALPTSLSAGQLQALKRQQRMIKNRESASLSRKKKKEYVTSLESQIDELVKENDSLRDENTNLKEKLSLYEPSLHWHKPSKLLDRTKKITAMFAVLFMISFNVASYRNFPRGTETGISNELIVKLGNNANHRSRSLLWADDGLASSESTSSDDFNKWNSAHQDAKCPLYINQTESLRLDSELRKWIDAYPADNATSPVNPKYPHESKAAQLPLVFSMSKKERKQIPRRKIPFSRELLNSRTTENEIKMFDFTNNIFDVNEPLYQAMDRKQDTFYVVSFSGDHLLLPAISQNQTFRPKMSLVLPSITSNDSYSSSDIITMMQIDCTVLDTRLLYVKEKDIPAHLKSQSLKNVQKSNASYAKQAMRRRLNPSYSLPVADKSDLSKNHQ